MLNPKDQAAMDQATSFMLEHFPPLWRRLYTSLVQEGFKESEALDLTKTYIIAQGTGDKLPPKT